MRVKFTSEIIGSQVNLGLVDETDDLNVVGRLHELDTLEGTLGNNSSTMAGLGAPGNFELFGVANGCWPGWRSPKTEI